MPELIAFSKVISTTTNSVPSVDLSILLQEIEIGRRHLGANTPFHPINKDEGISSPTLVSREDVQITVVGLNHAGDADEYSPQWSFMPLL